MYPKMGKASKEDHKYMAEDDCRTLLTAREIKADKARYSRAMKHAREKLANIKKVVEEGK